MGSQEEGAFLNVKNKHHLSRLHAVKHHSHQQRKGRNRGFISLPLLLRFSVGSPPYIKAMIIFLTTPALVRASGKETLCKM